MSRHIGRYRRKKQKRIIIITSLSLLLFLCVGYAAFSTNLTLKAKGNIKFKSFTTIDIIKDVVDSGDGLYKDDEGYYYKGENVNNNILLDNELWRIISIKNDGTLKVIKEAPLESAMAWDDGNLSITCDTDFEPFCEGKYWGNLSFSNDRFYGEWIGEVSLNTYLNTTYFDSLSNDFRNNIISEDFNIGFYEVMDYDWYGRVDAFTDFQSKKWSGKVGLIDVVEYVKSSTNSECVSRWLSIDGSNAVCTGSYLNTDSTENRRFIWTLNIRFMDGGYSGSLFFRSNGYGIFNSSTSTKYDVHPVVHLQPEIKLTGKGPTDSPYEIIY